MMKKWLRSWAVVAVAALAMVGAECSAQVSGIVQKAYVPEGAGAVARTVNDKLSDSRTLRDFGAAGDGVANDTAALQRAFNWLAGGNRTLLGEPSRTYIVSSKLNVSGTHILFDCQQCIIKNTINGNPADPMISITDTSSTYIRLANFTVQFDTPANKGHTISVIGNGNNPQVLSFENIQMNYQLGNGKDHNGASMPAYGLYVYGVYTVFVDRLYVANGSGGLFFDTVQKASITRTTIDSVTNYGMWFDGVTNAEVGRMSNVTGSGQDAQAAVYFNGCESFTFRDSRIKGGLGSQIMAGDTISRNVNIDSNHIEVYNANHTTIYLKPNTKSASVTNNFIKNIGSYGPFFASIGVIETNGATQSRGTFVIKHNLISVGGADTLANGIYLTTANDQISGAVIEGNSIGDSNSVSANITNAINLGSTGTNNVVRNNTIGAANNTVANGIVIGAGNTSASVTNNVTGGTVTTMLSNAGTGTRIYESGNWTPVVKGKTTAGTNTYSTQIGTYRRIDDVVYFTMNVALSSLGGTAAGYLAVDGLPYVSKNVASSYGGGSVLMSKFTFAAGTTMVAPYVQPGSTEVWFAFSGNSTAPVTATISNITSSFSAIVSGFYFTQ